MFCGQGCRQRDYEARRRAAELGLAEHELVVTRAELDALRDQLYVVACAADDVDAAETPADARRAVAYLLETVHATSLREA